MSTKFDDASKLWGREKLRNAGLNANEVKYVNFNVDHGDCCNCSDGYCYCMKDDSVDVTIFYKVAGIAQLRHLSLTYDLGNLLREVTEW